MVSAKSTVLSFLVATLVFSAAVPASDEAASHTIPIHEVIPGAGLPSLASLGITSAELHDPNFKPRPVPQSISESHPSKLFKRQRGSAPPQSCTYNSQYQTLRGDAVGCRNYLTQVGTYDCSTGSDYYVICTSGEAEVVAYNYYNYNGGVYANCADAAVAVGWVLDNCSTCQSDDCLVEGSQTSPSNQNYVAYVDRRS